MDTLVDETVEVSSLVFFKCEPDWSSDFLFFPSLTTPCPLPLSLVSVLPLDLIGCNFVYILYNLIRVSHTHTHAYVTSTIYMLFLNGLQGIG